MADYQEGLECGMHLDGEAHLGTYPPLGTSVGGDDDGDERAMVEISDLIRSDDGPKETK